MKKEKIFGGLIYKLHSGLIFEGIIVYIVFIFTWLGFGNYMAPLILMAFIFDLFLENKRIILFKDRYMLLLILSFVLLSLISSLLSIDKLKSSLLSLLWFFVIYVPLAYTRFVVNDYENNIFVKFVVPTSFVVLIIIVAYLGIKFINYSISHGLHFNRRYTFLWLGKATTPDTIVMLTGIGYSFVKSVKSKMSGWLALIFLFYSGFGIILTYDRGGVVSFFVVALILLILNSDYKKLIIFLLFIVLFIYLSFHSKYFNGIQHYFNFLYSTQVKKALESRQQLDTFKTAWCIIKEHWLFGVGTNNFSKFTKSCGSGHWYAYAHNFILQFWAENGLLGLLSALSIIVLTFRRWFFTIKKINPRYKNYVIGIGASFVGMLIGNLTNSTIWILKIALPFWMIVGIINGFYYLVRKY